MSRTQKTAAFILLAALGLVLVIWEIPRSKPQAGLPAATASTNLASQSLRLQAIDLSDFYDKDPSFDAPGCWQAVPRGLQVIANIPFRISGLIQLWGEGPAGIGRTYREMVEGIPVPRKFQTLYVLHGSSFTTVEGTPIAGVLFRYADGSAATNWIFYGRDSRDWWEPLAEHNPLPADSPSRIVWRGDHPSLPDWVRSLRLFGTSVLNPKPRSEVKCVDLISAKSRVAWVVLAMTTGPSGALKVDPQLEKEELPSELTEMTVVSLDSHSGQPVQNMQFRVTLVTGRRPKPYGIFTSDEHGNALIDLPPEHLKQLSIEAFATNYLPQQVSWNVAKGEHIPTNYVFKVTRDAP